MNTATNLEKYSLLICYIIAKYPTTAV